MSPTLKITLLSAGLTLVVGACSSQPNPALERAEIDLREAKNNPSLVERAPTLLEEASLSLDQARQVWRREKDSDEVEHLVYLSDKRLSIAREEARRKGSSSEASFEREQALAAAIDLRASASDAEVRARMNGEAVQHYRMETEANRQLIQELSQKVAAIQSQETERGLVLTLNDDVLFESGKAHLKPGAVLKLNSIATFLKEHSDRLALVEGHTDSKGPPQYNRDLSQRRADAVRSHFIRQGVDPRRVESSGLGQDFPIASNQSEAGRLQNRRVQIVISNLVG